MNLGYVKFLLESMLCCVVVVVCFFVLCVCRLM